MRTPTVVRQSWGSREVRAMLPSPALDRVPFPAAAAMASKGILPGGGGGHADAMPRMGSYPVTVSM